MRRPIASDIAGHYLGAGGRPIKRAAAEGPAGSTPLTEATVELTLDRNIRFGGASAGSDPPHIHSDELTPQVLGEQSNGETTAEMAHHLGAVFLH